MSNNQLTPTPWPWPVGRELQPASGRDSDPADRLLKAVALRAVRDIICPDKKCRPDERDTAIQFVQQHRRFYIYDCGIPRSKLDFMLHWANAQEGVSRAA